MALPPPPDLKAPFEFEEEELTTLSSSYSLSFVARRQIPNPKPKQIAHPSS